MILVEMGITPDRYNIRLLGTDISDEAVAKASYGQYNKFEVSRGLDKKRLDRFFDKQGDYYRIKDQIRVMAQFKKLNLMKPLTGIGTHDIILCRNVMIYFNPAARQRIYGNIAKSLESDGYLLIGSTESLSNDTDLFVSKKYLRSIFYQFK
jgi:chemotaxis protein methyltransferase CheR